MKTLKNSIILFLAMFAIGWIGFNIVKDSLERKAVSTDTPVTNPVSDDLNVSTLNVSASSSPVADVSQGGGGAEQQVKSMLKNRADAWNNRNLSRYMADYRAGYGHNATQQHEDSHGWRIRVNCDRRLESPAREQDHQRTDEPSHEENRYCVEDHD